MTLRKPTRARQTGPKHSFVRESGNSAFQRAIVDLQKPASAYPNISGRWLLAAGAIALVAALACAWLTLCLLYWQGNWQLLYHPKAAIGRTPASVGLAYEPVRFAATETGTPQLTGWWILPASSASSFGSRFMVLYLHGADGNLSDTVDALAALHREDVPVFAFDYRGYGQSQTGRPSETQLRQDNEWALNWLTLTKHIPAKTIVVYGSGLGARLAAELAADHSELAGVVLDQPYPDPMAQVFGDSRSKLVPAHWIVADRYDLNSFARRLRLPSLWLLANPSPSGPAHLPGNLPDAYVADPALKSVVWLNSPATADKNFAESLRRWLDDL